MGPADGESCASWDEGHSKSEEIEGEEESVEDGVDAVCVVGVDWEEIDDGVSLSCEPSIFTYLSSVACLGDGLSTDSCLGRPGGRL